MDSDLVYQAQWRESGASVEGITDFLSRVKCRPWVLQEICLVVPPTLRAAMALLFYGLRGTGLQLVLGLGEGDDTEEWVTEPCIYDCEDEAQLREMRTQEEEMMEKVISMVVTKAYFLSECVSFSWLKIRYFILSLFDFLHEKTT